MGEFGEEFGMPGEGDTAFVDHALVHRGGDHPGEMPVQAALPGSGQGIQHERRIGLVELARHYRGCGVSQTYRLPAGAGCSGHWPAATGSRLTASPSCVARSASRSRLVMAIRGGAGACGEQQAQVGAYAGRLAGGDGEAQGLHWVAWSAPGSLIST